MSTFAADTVNLVTDREFDFHPRDFSRVKSLIYDRAGISLHEGKQAMVYSRLSRRLRETGHASFESYLKWLEGGSASPQEWQEFINCLTTNLTAFFREEHHFEALAEWLGKRGNQPLRIWCSAASTGEEPYSLAITVAETMGLHANAKIIASDIDTNVLTTASRGVYDANARGLSPDGGEIVHASNRGREPGAVDIWEVIAAPPGLDEEDWTAPFDAVAEEAPINVLARRIADALGEMDEG